MGREGRTESRGERAGFVGGKEWETWKERGQGQRVVGYRSSGSLRWDLGGDDARVLHECGRNNGEVGRSSWERTDVSDLKWSGIAPEGITSVVWEGKGLCKKRAMFLLSAASLRQILSQPSSDPPYIIVSSLLNVPIVSLYVCSIIFILHWRLWLSEIWVLPHYSLQILQKSVMCFSSENSFVNGLTVFILIIKMSIIMENIYWIIAICQTLLSTSHAFSYLIPYYSPRILWVSPFLYLFTSHISIKCL